TFAVSSAHGSTSLLCFFFFFQAEDGIRDFHVTGVQTCALPISSISSSSSQECDSCEATRTVARRHCRSRRSIARVTNRSNDSSRSEERRVGKECRVRGSPGG